MAAQADLKQLGSCFKKTLHATEQDSESVQKLRAEFRASIGRESAANIIFLDESGTSREMIRRYGRGPVEVPVPDSAPGSWRTLTLSGAISLNGWVASMTMEAPTGADVFLAYLEHELCPLLKPGHIVVMDNLSAST